MQCSYELTQSGPYSLTPTLIESGILTSSASSHQGHVTVQGLDEVDEEGDSPATGSKKLKKKKKKLRQSLADLVRLHTNRADAPHCAAERHPTDQAQALLMLYIQSTLVIRTLASGALGVHRHLCWGHLLLCQYIAAPLSNNTLNTTAWPGQHIIWQ